MDDRLLLNYRHQDKAKAEILRVISFYKGLDAKREVFVFTDGRRMELVNLQGTVPITYKKNTYNIPICIWLMDTHPDHAPMCYLKPTPNMKINISQHVDHCGKIYAPYLHDWNQRDSDLLTLIQVLVMLFSQKPPLYAVPSGNNSTASQPQPNTPYPVQPQPYYNMPMPSTTAPTPYSPMPYPPIPQQCPYPVADATQPPYPVRSNLATPYPPYPMPQTAAITQPQPGSTTGTITEEHIHASLLSAAEDKVRRNIREHISQWKAELETLERIQTELTQGKERLAQLMARLETEQSEWEKVLTTLRDKDAELDAALQNLSNQGEMDVDEAVVTTAPLYKQLLTAFAEEAATEDAIYYLGEGLRRGVIDLDVFLKHVRGLSRKQFMLRALMHKCRNKAGLAC